MTDTPNRPPLWEVMEQARDAAISAYHPFAREEWCLASEIRALRDWLAWHPALGMPPEIWVRFHALLTTEADRAERGEVQ